MTATDATEQREAGPGGPLFWTSTALGFAVVAFAIAKLRATSSGAAQSSLARFLFGAGIAHDALWAPLAVAVGLVTSWVVPTWARVPVRLGAAFTALVVLVSWPEVRAYGRTSRNPSILPGDYGRSLVVVLGLVWAGVLLAIVVRGRSAHSAARAPR